MRLNGGALGTQKLAAAGGGYVGEKILEKI